MYTLQNVQANVTATTQGAYVTRWQKLHNGQLVDILYQGSELKRTGIPVLFPNFGKSRILPQHGFARNATWVASAQTEESIMFTLEHTEVDSDMKQLYPSQFTAQVILSLTKDGDLIYTLRVINTDGEPVPISPGLHPYWIVNHAQKKDITIPDIPDFDATKIDWDHNPPDTAYSFSKKIAIQFPDKELTVEDISPDGTICKYLQVWSQPIDAVDHNFICFEPITRGNFGLEQDPIIVAAGETWEMKISFSVKLI
jgi:galactose mutarotase-like enzyme